MPVSVSTNVGALLGQRYIRATDKNLQVTQNRVASGLRVAGSQDDASTFAVAQGLRGNLKAYTSIAGALGGAKAYASVAVTAAEQISTRLQDVQSKITQLADESLSTSQRSAYQTELTSLQSEINSYISQAQYNGTNLLTASTTASVKTVANVDLSSITVSGQGVANLAIAAITSISDVATASTANGTVNTFRNTINTALANLGASIKQIEAQQEFVAQISETVQIGLGDLVDADIAKETAQLQSLQVRQQLGVQALGIANGNPQTLLGLLR